MLNQPTYLPTPHPPYHRHNHNYHPQLLSYHQSPCSGFTSTRLWPNVQLPSRWCALLQAKPRTTIVPTKTPNPQPNPNPPPPPSPPNSRLKKKKKLSPKNRRCNNAQSAIDAFLHPSKFPLRYRIPGSALFLTGAAVKALALCMMDIVTILFTL